MNLGDVAQLYRNQGRAVPAEFQGEKEIRAHKYGAKQKQVNGIAFASSLEAEAYRILKLWESAGAIKDLELQPEFLLEPKQVIDGKTIRAIKYRGDFLFQRDGRSVCVDCKGFRNRTYIIKSKLFRARFPLVILEEWDRAKVKELARC